MDNPNLDMVDNPSATEVVGIDMDMAVRLLRILSIPWGLIGLEGVVEQGVLCGGGEGEGPPEEDCENPWLSMAVFMSVMLCRAARGPGGLLVRFPRVKLRPPFACEVVESNKERAAEALLQASMFSPERRLNMAWLGVEVGEVWE